MWRPRAFLWGCDLAGQYACVAEARFVWPHEGVLEVFDVSVPSQPVLAGSAAMPEWAFEVAPAGHHVFVLTGSSLQSVDISDPNHPSIVASLPVGGQAMAVSRGYAYIAHYPGVSVVNLADPRDPVWVADLPTVGGVNGLAISGDWAYLAEDMVGLQVVDISDPEVPRIVGTGTDPDGNPLGTLACVAVRENLACLTDYDSRVLMVDVSDPRRPVEIGEIAVLLRPAGSSFGSGVLMAEEGLYVASNGLDVVNLEGAAWQPARMRLVGGCWIGQASRVARSEEHVYVTSDFGYGTGSLYILPRQCLPGATSGTGRVDPAAVCSRLLATPNPAGPETPIRLDLGYGGGSELTIFNARGCEVRRLSCAKPSAGLTEILWDGRDAAGRLVPAGVYLARVAAKDGPRSARIVLVK